MIETVPIEGARAIKDFNSLQMHSQERTMKEEGTTDATVLGRLKQCWTGGVQIEDAKAVKVFRSLQVLSACFLSFSHGANDTAFVFFSLFAKYRVIIK